MEGLSKYSLPKSLVAAREAASRRYLEPAKGRWPGIAPRAKQNLVGVGIARKIREGRQTSELGVCFYVERKVPLEELAAGDILPEDIEGLPTDVVETGRFHALADSLIERLRPARPGCSIGRQDDPIPGTFGALVEADGKLFILSNNHVLADGNALSEGTPILQPGFSDRGSAATDQIARLSRLEPLKVDADNIVDCAIAEVLEPDLVDPAIMLAGRLGSAEPLDAAVDMAVEKTGRKTRFTSGVITDVTAEIVIPYSGLGEIAFKDQIMIVGHDGTPFSAEGDSGSLIVESDSKRPVGLIFAGSGRRSVANHIQDVLDVLGVKIVA